MVVRAATQGPVVEPFTLLNGQVVDAGDATHHQALVVEFPIFIAIGAIPMAAVVVPLIGKADGDAVISAGPEFFDQAVVKLAAPFALQEGNDGLAPLDKLGPIAPDAVAAVGQGDPLGVAAIPAVFGQTHFLGGGCGRERWQGRTGSFRCRLAGSAGGHGGGEMICGIS